MALSDGAGSPHRVVRRRRLREVIMDTAPTSKAHFSGLNCDQRWPCLRDATTLAGLADL